RSLIQTFSLPLGRVGGEVGSIVIVTHKVEVKAHSPRSLPALTPNPLPEGEGSQKLQPLTCTTGVPKFSGLPQSQITRGSSYYRMQVPVFDWRSLRAQVSLMVSPWEPISRREDSIMRSRLVVAAAAIAVLSVGTSARAACCYFSAKNADILQPAQKVFI